MYSSSESAKIDFGKSKQTGLGVCLSIGVDRMLI